MTPVVFLGIDGLDWRFIEANLDRLPTFRSMAATGVLTALPSIFPPDSIPAWITIFTGEPPDHHGVIESIDYLAKNPAKATERAPDLLRGRTFWDVVSSQGHTVCIVNPFLAYPAWPVRGAMISGPVFVGDASASVEPADAVGELPLPQLGGIVDFPTEDTMRDFVQRTLEVTERQALFGLEMLRRSEPHLFFMNILTIDRMQHFLWRFCDATDPTYPGASELSDAIFRAYAATDQIVGRYVDAVDGGTVLVASDHGHGMRPPTMLYVDEMLRRADLFSTGGLKSTIRTFALEKAKRGVLRAAFHFGREHEAYKLARRVPGKKALKHSTYARAATSSATASRAFGRNSTGGVEIADTITGEERRKLAAAICDLLMGVRDERGRPVCRWARLREEMLSGPEARRFPDVLFRLREDVGVDFGVFGPLLGPDTMHRRISGGHLEDGVFAASTADLPFVPKRLEQLHKLAVSVVISRQ